MIDALYGASRAGVPDRPGRAGLVLPAPRDPRASETIAVRSIVGQFLEHSRIYRFGGAPGSPGAAEEGLGRPLRLSSAPPT